MSDHLVCNKSKTTGATSGAGTTYTFGAPKFTPVFGEVCVDQSLVFYVVLCILWFVLFSFGHCFVYISSIYGF
jgi:hypothetical protein